MDLKCKKDEAIAYAKSIADDFDRVTISSQPLRISEVKDVLGEYAFPNEKDVSGWLIFFDEDIFANWGHECRYIFYAGTNLDTGEAVVFEREMYFPPVHKTSLVYL